MRLTKEAVDEIHLDCRIRDTDRITALDSYIPVGTQTFSGYYKAERIDDLRPIIRDFLLQLTPGFSYLSLQPGRPPATGSDRRRFVWMVPAENPTSEPVRWTEDLRTVDRLIALGIATGYIERSPSHSYPNYYYNLLDERLAQD